MHCLFVPAPTTESQCCFSSLSLSSSICIPCFALWPRCIFFLPVFCFKPTWPVAPRHPLLFFYFAFSTFPTLFSTHRLPSMTFCPLTSLPIFLLLHSPALPATTTAPPPPLLSRLVSPITVQRAGARVSLCPLIWARWAKPRIHPARQRGGELLALPRWIWQSTSLVFMLQKSNSQGFLSDVYSLRTASNVHFNSSCVF